MHYYICAINILVKDLNLEPKEAIEKLRISADKRDAIYNKYMSIKRREMEHFIASHKLQGG